MSFKMQMSHVTRQPVFGINTITVNDIADLFIYTPVGRASDLMLAQRFQLSWLEPDGLSLVGPTGVQLLDFCFSIVSELVCC